LLWLIANDRAGIPCCLGGIVAGIIVVDVNCGFRQLFAERPYDAGNSGFLVITRNENGHIRLIQLDFWKFALLCQSSAPTGNCLY